MYQFDISIHARPSNTCKGFPIELHGRPVVPLTIESSAANEPMPVSFECAVEALSKLPRMFVEPDGSFVWVGGDLAPWQVDGVLYDRGDKLLFVELRGRCPENHLDELLRAFGWPDCGLMFQLTREAVFLDEEQFRQYADINR